MKPITELRRTELPPNAAEFQAAFDKAKKLAMVHNAKVTGSPALSASPSGLPGYATEVEK